MNNSPVLPVNPIETAQSATYRVLGITLVQVHRKGPGFGFLAIILGDAPGCLPPEAHALEYIAPRYKSVALKARPRSPHELRLLKIRIEDLATRLSPAVWWTP